MPERPAVRAAQLSAWPCPSDVTTPMPVTATKGRPCASRVACAMLTSLTRLGEPHHAFAAPVSDGGGHRLAGLARPDQRRRERHAEQRLRLHDVATGVP